MTDLRSLARVALVSLGVCALAAVAQAQMSRPKAVLTPLVETDGVHAGTSVSLALQVTLPEGVHVQSDKPRDPSLIPTALTFDAPTGITVTAVTYPAPTDLRQSGQSQPLAVFEQRFTVNVQVSVASSLPPGDVLLRGRLRYQACDAQTCYIPAREEVQWSLHVVPKATPIHPQNRDVFEKTGAKRSK